MHAARHLKWISAYLIFSDGAENYNEIKTTKPSKKKIIHSRKTHSRKLINKRKDKNNISPNPCSLKRNCANKCYEISEEERLKIYNSFKRLTKMEKRVWAQERRFEINIKRKRTKNFESKRKMSYLHYVDINGEMRQVCLQFLASTVNVSRRFFVYNKMMTKSVKKWT